MDSIKKQVNSMSESRKLERALYSKDKMLLDVLIDECNIEIRKNCAANRFLSEESMMVLASKPNEIDLKLELIKNLKVTDKVLDEINKCKNYRIQNAIENKRENKNPFAIFETFGK